MMFDTLICNGTLVDGTGAGARQADLGIRNEVIADIGDSG